MNELHDKILANLPASMNELAESTGVRGQALWDAVHTLRKAGILRRYGPHDHRMFEKVGARRKTNPDAAPDEPPSLTATEQQKREKKERKRAVILFYFDGWPAQDPSRRMVWAIAWGGSLVAQREIKRLDKKFRKDGVQWELASMSLSDIRRMKSKGFNMTDQLDRERQLRATEKRVSPK